MAATAGDRGSDCRSAGAASENRRAEAASACAA